MLSTSSTFVEGRCRTVIIVRELTKGRVDAGSCYLYIGYPSGNYDVTSIYEISQGQIEFYTRREDEP